jgi:hypothetical protein
MGKAENYDDLMARLRSLEPLLDGEDELSAGVTGRIKRLGAVKASRRRALITGGMSVAAALFLVAAMSGEILTYPRTPEAGTTSALRREHAPDFKNMSKDDIEKIVSERRKKDRERELIINRYLKKTQSHEN